MSGSTIHNNTVLDITQVIVEPLMVILDLLFCISTHFTLVMTDRITNLELP